VTYQGPTKDVAAYFRGLGFQCPERKGIADFLQEICSSMANPPPPHPPPPHDVVVATLCIPHRSPPHQGNSIFYELSYLEAGTQRLNNVPLAIQDQQQYWDEEAGPYRYISCQELAERFKLSHHGAHQATLLKRPWDAKQQTLDVSIADPPPLLCSAMPGRYLNECAYFSTVRQSRVEFLALYRHLCYTWKEQMCGCQA